MTDLELMEALRAMRQLGETLREVVSDYQRVYVEFEELRALCAELDERIAAVHKALDDEIIARDNWENAS